MHSQREFFAHVHDAFAVGIAFNMKEVPLPRRTGWINDESENARKVKVLAQSRDGLQSTVWFSSANFQTHFRGNIQSFRVVKGWLRANFLLWMALGAYNKQFNLNGIATLRLAPKNMQFPEQRLSECISQIVTTQLQITRVTAVCFAFRNCSSHFPLCTTYKSRSDQFFAHWSVTFWLIDDSHVHRLGKLRTYF